MTSCTLEELYLIYDLKKSLEKLAHIDEENLQAAAAIAKGIMESIPLPSQRNDISKASLNLLLSKALTDQNLHLLHIAAIHGDAQSVKAFLEAGGDVNIQDHRKWTPLHHASLLRRQAMVDLLLQSGASSDALTDAEGTYLDVERLTHFKPLPDDKKLPVYYLNDSGEETLLTSKKFHELCHSQYIEESLFTQEKYLLEWKRRPEKVTAFEIAEADRANYEALIRERPKHFIAQVTHDSQGRKLSCETGLGLFARQKIDKGQVIGEYHGLWSANPRRSNYSVAEGPDALHYANEECLINDGFPNCSMISIRNRKGIPMRCLFIAIDPIHPGEQICWNYGSWIMKKQPYGILRPKEMEEYLRGKDIPEVVDRYALFLGDPKVDLDTFCEVSKTRYILQTPSAIWWMVLKEVIPLETAFYLVAGALYTLSMPKEEKPYLQDMLKAAKELLEIKAQILAIDKATADEFVQILLEFPERYESTQALARARDLGNAWKIMLAKYK